MGFGSLRSVKSVKPNSNWKPKKCKSVKPNGNWKPKKCGSVREVLNLNGWKCYMLALRSRRVLGN